MCTRIPRIKNINHNPIEDITTFQINNYTKNNNYELGKIIYDLSEYNLYNFRKINFTSNELSNIYKILKSKINYIEYRRYPDLINMSDNQLLEHYINYGQYENRIPYDILINDEFYNDSNKILIIPLGIEVYIYFNNDLKYIWTTKENLENSKKKIYCICRHLDTKFNNYTAKNFIERIIITFKNLFNRIPNINFSIKINNEWLLKDDFNHLINI